MGAGLVGLAGWDSGQGEMEGRVRAPLQMDLQKKELSGVNLITFVEYLTTCARYST